MPNNRFNKQVTPKGYQRGGSVKEESMRDRMKQPLKTKAGPRAGRPKSTPDDLQKKGRPKIKVIKVEGNKIIEMKKGGVASEAKKKQFKANQANQKTTTKKVLKAIAGPFNPISAGQNVAKKIKDRMGRKMGGALKPVDPKTQKGLSKLPTEVRNKMGYMKKGGKVHGK